MSLCSNTPGELQAMSPKILSFGSCNNVPDLVQTVPCVCTCKKRNLCFHSPTGGDVSCDCIMVLPCITVLTSYGVYNGTQHEGLFHFLFMTAVNVRTSGQH